MLVEKKILIVDDEEAILELLEIALSAKHLKSVVTTTPQGAIGEFRTGRFRLALLDVDLHSYMNGIDLARKLRELDPGLGILIMSGNHDNADKVHQAGFGPMIKKPFDFSEIESRMNDRCEK